MKKEYFVKVGYFILILMLLGGCGLSKSSQEKELIRSKAKAVGIEYFKQNYNVDIVITEVKVMPSYIDITVGVYGHIKGEKDQHVFLMLERPNYDVIDGVLFEGFSEKYPLLQEEETSGEKLLDEQEKSE
ncbi:hypothetical protein V3851_22275 [Paenibacillus sp. M1]|uniref:DUF1433 domain-containing protein n=1 Tax=Paenibacillus haidiansis TaxID=1574488 RepID=A0ABU7W069_9BACL